MVHAAVPAAAILLADEGGIPMHVNADDELGAKLGRLYAALEASCVVGTWDWDHVRDVVTYDAGAAKLMTGDADLADQEVSGLLAYSSLHPDDQAWVVEHVQRAAESGGLLLAEFRVLAQDGTVRWILKRGRTYVDPAGNSVCSRGILIDITEMRDGGERYILGEGPQATDPLERAADLAIAVKQTLGAGAPPEVGLLADLLLMSLGRAIAEAGQR
jgi:PAS domain S-box-containing protein